MKIDPITFAVIKSGLDSVADDMAYTVVRIARSEIVKDVNDGVIMWNYVGHGSPFKLADEAVFLATDPGALTNADRLPLFIAASCDVGRFSDPNQSSLGENLVLHSGGGAIGVISATDLAFSYANSVLNQAIFRSLFGRPGGGTFSGGVSEALTAAKIEASACQTCTNAQKFQFMGDAATRLISSPTLRLP